MSERTTVQQAYIRVCRDSQFRLAPAEASKLAAGALGTHPLRVLMALGWDNMKRIAAGTHPCLKATPPPPRMTGG